MRQREPLYVILGGGLAGLSLAWHLLDAGTVGRIVILDPRMAYTDDRTWCFWDLEPHPFRHLIRHRWWRWRVAADKATVTCTGTVPYARIPAGDLYACLLARCRSADQVDLRLGRRAAVVTEDGRKVTLDDGTRLHADAVFDGRPPKPDPAWRPRMHQIFAGRRVATDRPVFDPTTITLMDFANSSPGEIVFSYTLPFDRHRALIELTAFVPDGTTGPDVTARLDVDLDRRIGADRVDADAEAGLIPMEPTPPPRTPHTIPIGTRAGAPRAATGYAFLPIQRHCAALARAAVAGSPHAKPVRSFATNALDRIFLERLTTAPDAAPSDFMRMFGNVDPTAMARFLSERASLRENVQIMASLPTAPYLTAAARVAGTPVRRVSRTGPASIDQRA